MWAAALCVNSLIPFDFLLWNMLSHRLRILMFPPYATWSWLMPAYRITRCPIIELEIYRRPSEGQAKIVIKKVIPVIPNILFFPPNCMLSCYFIWCVLFSGNSSSLKIHRDNSNKTVWHIDETISHSVIVGCFEYIPSPIIDKNIHPFIWNHKIFIKRHVLIYCRNERQDTDANFGQEFFSEPDRSAKTTANELFSLIGFSCSSPLTTRKRLIYNILLL